MTFTLTIESNELDKYDKNILMVMLEAKKEIGFNKLLKKLNEKGKFTRQTLSTHLKSLEKETYITHKQEESKSPWKPSHYSLNSTAIDKFIMKNEPDLEKCPWDPVLDVLKQNVGKVDFQNLARETMRFIYLSDLEITTLFIEGLREKNKDNKEMKVAKAFLSLALGSMLKQLTILGLKMKDEDFQIVLDEFNTQVSKVQDYYKTGKLPA